MPSLGNVCLALWALSTQISTWEHVTRPGLVRSWVPGQVGPCLVGKGRGAWRQGCLLGWVAPRDRSQPSQTTPSRPACLYFQSVSQPGQL